MMRSPLTILLVALAPALAGCASHTTTQYLHPNVDLGAMKTVAVLPFENVTQEQTAGEKVQRIFITELLATGVFQVVEPGAVNKALRAERSDLAVSGLAPADLKRLGEALKVDGFFMGTVIDFNESHSGSTPAPEVTVQLRLVEAQSGVTVWNTSKTRSGASLSARMFGVGGDSLTQAAREVVREELHTLVK
ncbi:MAG TPA: CsgG/HfaB family protein [Vicinamibacteria bacterium]|nr:CsgG/HfaB family protein [Vicinamibacteria bacterium]